MFAISTVNFSFRRQNLNEKKNYWKSKILENILEVKIY